MWTSFTRSDNLYEDALDSGFSIGFATGTTAGKMHSVGMFEDDGSANSVSRRWNVNNSATAWMRKYSPTGTLQHNFYLNSFLSNGFRITFDLNDANPYIYNYLVIWGIGLTANSGSFNASTTIGNNTFAHGLGAVPGFLMTLSANTAADNTNTTGGQLAIGMASSITQQVGMAAAVPHGLGTMDTFSYMPTEKLVVLLNNLNGTLDGLSNLSALDATNATITWTDAPAAAARVSWLAINGGLHDVHELLAPDAVGDASEAGLSFRPQGIFTFTRGAAATTTSDPHCKISVGAGKEEGIMRSALYGSEDATTNAETVTRSTCEYIAEINPSAIAASASATAKPGVRAKIKTLDTTGYTLQFDETITDAVFGVWAFAQSGSGTAGSDVDITETAISATDSIATQLTANRAPAEESISATDQIVASKHIFVNIADSVSASDSLDKASNTFRTLPEGVNVSDALQTSAAGSSIGINETPITVSDSVTRQLVANRGLTESTTASDQSAQQFTAQRTIEESVRVIIEREFNVDEFNPDEFGQVGEQVKAVRNAILEETAITTADAVTTSLVTNRAPAVETVSVSDQITTVKLMSVFISESVNVSGAPPEFNPDEFNPDELNTTSSEVTRQLNASRGIAEALGVSEALQTSALNSSIGINETPITVSDSVSRTLLANRGISETTNVTDTDTPLRILAAQRALAAESVIIGDNVGTGLFAEIPLTEDALSATDAVATMAAYFRTIPESVNISDSVVGDPLFNLNRTLAESVEVSDSVAAVVSYFRTIAETVTIADVITITNIGPRSRRGRRVTGPKRAPRRKIQSSENSGTPVDSASRESEPIE